MSRLRNEIEVFASQGSVDKIPIIMVKEELHPIVVKELKRVVGVTKVNTLVERAILLVASSKLRHQDSIFDQLDFDRTSAFMRAFADETSSLAMRPSGLTLITVHPLRWQLLVIASRWSMPPPSATEFGNIVLKECAELMLPILGPME